MKKREADVTRPPVMFRLILIYREQLLFTVRRIHFNGAWIAQSLFIEIRIVPRVWAARSTTDG